MEDKAPKEISRRAFLGVGGAGVGAIVGGLLTKGFFLPDAVYALPASEGYLLIDTMKCGGCESCMLACSLVHEGRVNLSLSRIQINQNPFGKFPDDISPTQCRQCPAPACLEACPTKALHVDAANGNVRTVDPAKCIGCERCVQACPFTPGRAEWNYEDKHAFKCDLCAATPHWNKVGGPGGHQACVEACPMKAITFTKDIPVQQESGYHPNLRNEHWGKLGFPTSNDGSLPPKAAPVAAPAAKE
jgi:protein NrfC